jgi:hypothetical protein
MDRLYDCVGDSVFNYKDIGDLVFAIPVTPWSKLYKNSFIQRNNIRFPEGLVFDDNIFFWDVLFSADRIAFYKKHLFTRRWYSYSSTKAGDLRFIDSIAINNLMIDRFKKYGQFEKHKETLYNRKVNLCYDKFVYIKPEYQEDFYVAFKEDCQKILDNNLYDDYYYILDRRNKKIFKTLAESKSYYEFKFQMAYFDAHNSRRKGEEKQRKLKRTLNDLKKKNSKLKSKHKSLKNEMDNLKNENKKISDLRNKITDIDNKINNIQKENGDLKQENNKIRKENKLYENSNSWKVTKPLRDFKNKM